MIAIDFVVVVCAPKLVLLIGTAEYVVVRVKLESKTNMILKLVYCGDYL